MVFDKETGVSPLRTNIRFAKDQGLIGGNKNKMYFINNKEESFSLVNVEECFRENPNLYKIMYEHILPVLETYLGTTTEFQEQIDAGLLEY